MSDSRPFARIHNMADQSRRAAYRTPYPRVREIEDDDDDEEEENDNTRRGGLQMVSTQRKDTVPMSDDERFFGKTNWLTSLIVPLIVSVVSR